MFITCGGEETGRGSISFGIPETDDRDLGLDILGPVLTSCLLLPSSLGLTLGILIPGLGDVNIPGNRCLGGLIIVGTPGIGGLKCIGSPDLIGLNVLGIFCIGDPSVLNILGLFDLNTVGIGIIGLGGLIVLAIPIIMGGFNILGSPGKTDSASLDTSGFSSPTLSKQCFKLLEDMSASMDASLFWLR